MFEWGDVDQFSFDDSDRFEEDSICSFVSEPESVVNNWRGWRKQQQTANTAANGNAPALGQNRKEWGKAFALILSLCVQFHPHLFPFA